MTYRLVISVSAEDPEKAKEFAAALEEMATTMWDELPETDGVVITLMTTERSVENHSAMNWAIERDDSGMPTRMVYVPRMWAREKRIGTQEITGPPPCPRCGYRFGWHTSACSAERRID